MNRFPFVVTRYGLAFAVVSNGIRRWRLRRSRIPLVFRAVETGAVTAVDTLELDGSTAIQSEPCELLNFHDGDFSFQVRVSTKETTEQIIAEVAGGWKLLLRPDRRLSLRLNLDNDERTTLVTPAGCGEDPVVGFNVLKTGRWEQRIQLLVEGQVVAEKSVAAAVRSNQSPLRLGQTSSGKPNFAGSLRNPECFVTCLTGNDLKLLRERW